VDKALENNQFVINPLAVYTTEEAGILLRQNVKSPHRLASRLCQKKQIRAQLPSKKEGWRILGQAIIDYLMIKGG
jgi:hypothetical protein